MQTYIALLRGINVNGQKLIKMEDLKTLFFNLKYHSVETYLQSGNVIFQTKNNDINNIAVDIEKAIKDKFALDVPVLVLAKEKLANIITNNNWLELDNYEEAFIHFTFLFENDVVLNSEIIAQKKHPREDFKIGEDVIYLYCPEGYGKTKLTNNFFEQRFKTIATTRNLRTVLQLLNMANTI